MSIQKIQEIIEEKSVKNPIFKEILEKYKKCQCPMCMCSRCKERQNITERWTKRDGTFYNKYICQSCGYIYYDYNNEGGIIKI